MNKRDDQQGRKKISNLQKVFSLIAVVALALSSPSTLVNKSFVASAQDVQPSATKTQDAQAACDDNCENCQEDPCGGDPCCGDSCCGDPCCGDPCCGDPCCGDPNCGQYCFETCEQVCGDNETCYDWDSCTNTCYLWGSDICWQECEWECYG